MPVNGKVIEINIEVKNNPSLINSASFTNGWIIKIEVSNPEDINTLISATDYEELVS